jgi:twitching motility protein PilT
MEITELLVFSVKNKASDLHLSAGAPPLIRVDGELRRINLPALTPTDVKNLIYGVMNDDQRKQFEACLELDFSFEIKDLCRFRVNVFNQERGPAGVFRIIPSAITTLDDLKLPEVFKTICGFNNGLVLITGSTGSGKSTTLSAMIDFINEHRSDHIITIEDPIEFVHKSKKCLVNQREVHHHTKSFNAALRSALREDPNIILVGELRDTETIRLALTASETGHLVFATLHTSSAAKTINRIIDVFPAGEKEMVRSMLSDSLQAVISQSLMKRIGGGRIAGLEIMLCNPAIRNLIREDKVAQMYSVIQTGQAQGMQTLDQHIQALLGQRLITGETAKFYAISKDTF